MKTSIIRIIFLAAIMMSGAAFGAPPSVTVGTGGGQVGSPAPVNINMDWNADGVVALIQFDITFNNANLSLTTATCNDVLISVSPLELITFDLCEEVAPGTIRILARNTLNNPITDFDGGTLMGTLTFDISGAAIGLYPLTVEGEVYGDTNSDPVPSGGSDNGQIDVAVGPQPDWSSVPDSATGLDWFNKVVDTGAYELPLQVTNAGEDGSTLTGTCQVSGSAVFSIVGDNTLGAGLAMGLSQNITVACNTADAALILHQGTLSCDHNGDGTTETSSTDYALSCNITEGPQPAFSGTPNGLDSMSVPKQGDLPEPSGTLSVQNVGDTTTLLSGSCSASGGDAGKFSVSNGTFTDLAAQDDSGPTHIVTVSCNTSAEGNFTSSLACEYGAAGSPTNYPLACTVGPPGDAEFGSTIAPAVGAEINIDLTPGGVLVDTVVAPIPLNISNDAPDAVNDRDLPFSCIYAGDPAISVGNMSGSPLAPLTSAGGVSFSCDTSVVGPYAGTYTCTYSEDGGETDQMADWNVSCVVRDPESDVDPDPPGTPPDGDTLTETVQAGGTASFTVDFNEVADEGESGQLTSCSLADGTNFTITSPVGFPVPIPAGGPSVTVTVEGTDPADGSNPTDTLTCVYTDTANPSGTDAVYPLVLVVGVFESIPIPTLSQYGLAILALLMLGIGMVGFRRFN